MEGECPGWDGTRLYLKDIRRFQTIDQVINKPFKPKDDQGIDMVVVRSKSQVNLYQIKLSNRRPISDGGGPGQSKYIIEGLKTNTSPVDRCLRRMGAKDIKYHFYVLTIQHVSSNAMDTFEDNGVQLLQREDVYDLWPGRVREFAQKNALSWITGDD